MVTRDICLLFIAFIITFFTTASVAATVLNVNAPTTVSLNIKNADGGQTIPSTMHGLILETNINRDDDGGLYAELIYNRAFQEKGRSLDGWLVYGQASPALNNDRPLSSALPVHMRYSLTTASASASASGFRNGGFYGMNIIPGNYSVNLFYRPLSGASVGGNRLTVGFSDANGQTTYATSTLDVSSASADSWNKLSANISVVNAPPSAKNYFFVEFPSGSKGDFDFNLISCFPPTFKNRVNGARIDIAQAFADLKPGFVRLPGGNDVEGPSIAERFIWNETIGPLENRPGRRGTWTGYNTEGFGLLEMLTFVEDIGAIPVLAVYAAYSLNHQAVPEDQLQPYIDEVINEIEFLTASADESPLGALRAQFGRREPFDIRYVEIGNEDFTSPSTYQYRWPAFYNALSRRFPNITYIATTMENVDSPPAVDDHDYRSSGFFINSFRRYENIPRPTPKVLVGEFAVRDVDDLQASAPHLDYPTLKGAVGESVYRIGFERNSDVIIGGCYAPVLQNINQTQWSPNLIVFNASLVDRTVSHLAQQIYGQNLGNIVLKSTAANSSMTHESVQEGGEGDGKLGNLYFVANKNTTGNTLIVKFASVDQNDINVNVQVDGSTTGAEGIAYILAGGPGVDPGTIKNTMENPNAISIATKSVSSSDGRFSITIPSWSVVAVKLPL